MKFGKLPSIELVDFSLPVDPASTRAYLSKIYKDDEIAKFYIGCTGWSEKQWVGKVYPDHAKTKEYLKFYSRQFNTIELNTTHYRIPNAATIQKWKAETPDDFKFCPKILQAISHRRELAIGTSQLNQFCEAIIQLDEKVGCCFMQLPPYFGYDRLGLLERFLKEWPQELPLAVEFRQESIFDNPDHQEECFAMLESLGISLVITDVAGRRDVLHMGITAPKVMVRFVGNELHETDYHRIDDWVQRLRKWIAQGIKEIYFFPHEPDNLLAPELCVYLTNQIKNIPNISYRGPDLEKYKSGGNQGLLF